MSSNFIETQAELVEYWLFIIGTLTDRPFAYEIFTGIMGIKIFEINLGDYYVFLKLDELGGTFNYDGVVHHIGYENVEQELVSILGKMIDAPESLYVHNITSTV